MTRPELIRWANDPYMPDGIQLAAIAAAVVELCRDTDVSSASIEALRLTLRLTLRNAQSALRTYEAECARLRKAALPQAPWESEDVPL